MHHLSGAPSQRLVGTSPQQHSRLSLPQRRPLARPCAVAQQAERQAEASQTGDKDPQAAASTSQPPQQQQQQQQRRRRTPESTDATASFLTRRFGLAGGLAWAGFLAFGVVSEQIKTRLENAAESKGTQEVAAPSERDLHGVLFTETRRGGGATPQRGDLVLLDFRLTRAGEELADTFASGRPVLFSFGNRPLPPNLCPGVEEALKAMRADGRARVRVPFKSPLHAGIEGSELEYDLSLNRVSVAPS